MMFTALVTPRWMSCKVVAGKPIRSLLHRMSLGVQNGTQGLMGTNSAQPGLQDCRSRGPTTLTRQRKFLFWENNQSFRPL